jgi:Galactose oxidase, central domain
MALIVFKPLALGLIFSCAGAVSSSQDAATGFDAGFVNSDSGEALDAGLPACLTETHLCEGTCRANDSILTCGSSCSPCNTPLNSTAACISGACDFICSAGFERCLGQCVLADAGACPVNLRPNVFVQLNDGGVGTRSQAALIYLKATKEYVLIGGARTHDAQPYDIQALQLGDTAWHNVFPSGKEISWGPLIGPSSAPGFASERFEMSDTSGFPRPSFEVYGGMYSYGQSAWLASQHKLLFYVWNHTFSYDALGRTWDFHSTAAQPSGGVDKPRLLWSSMAANNTGSKVLLFGGANIENSTGTPGTWIYEPATTVWRKVNGREPPARSYSSMSTDPERNEAVFFGGDQLDQLLSDTWTFNFETETWAKHAPPISPSARGGHRLLYLPATKATVLLGGFTSKTTTDYVDDPYQSIPFEIWRFDFATRTWTLIKHFARGAPEMTPSSVSAGFTFAAAVGDDDVAVLHHRAGYVSQREGAKTWAIKLDVTNPDIAGTAVYGVTAGTVTKRGNRFDPAWFSNAGAPDAGEVAANLERIIKAPDNAWVEIAAPNRPESNHDWGTAAFDSDHQQLLRWSGGHSAWCGTDVLQYSLAENRFSIGYKPEIPFEYNFTNDQVAGHWSPQGRPWMTPHTYKMYTYAPAFSRMVIYKDGYTYFYDASKPVMDFDAARVAQDLGGNQYVNTLTAIPTGLIAWTPQGLYKLENRNGPWLPLSPNAVAGAALPPMQADSQTAVYESANNRLLMFSNVGAAKGEVYEYSLSANTLKALAPIGKATLAAHAPTFFRESALLPKLGVVMFATDFQTPADMAANVKRVPIYDATQNRWSAWKLTSQTYGNSFAVVADAANNRIWGMAQRNQVFVLKLNVTGADVEPLN